MKIIFSTPIKFNVFSQLIKSRLIIGTPFSHVAISAYISDIGEQIFFECSEKGVRVLEKSIFLKTNKVVDSFDIDVPPFRQREILNFIFSHMGKEYDYISTILCLFSLHIEKLKSLLPKKNGNKFHCSEFVYHCFQKEIDPQHNIPKDQVQHLTPKDLYWLLTQHYKNKKIEQEREREDLKNSVIPLAVRF